MGIDKKPRQCTVIGDLHLLAVDEHGSSRPVTLRDVRCAPSFRDTLLSVGQLCTPGGAECRFGAHNRLILPADGSGHQPSFRLHRNGGLYDLHAQVVSHRAATSTAVQPRSMTVRAAKATSHIHAMPPGL
eukprot:6020778-Pleurochrysis_carterae.AAC.1